MSARRRNSQSGFAMLFVFVMAAAVSILLFIELPRVAFERQRDKEQLLIDRGEQYKRAIQLYYRKNKKYPASLDDLETTSNIRYLRRRYSDPITGKNEWRLIHSTNGVFTDSLTKAPPGGEDPNKKTAEPNTFTWNAPAIGTAGTEGQNATALYNRQRPSDSANHIPGGTSPFPGAQGQTPQVGPDGQPIVNPNAPVNPQQPVQGFNPAMPGFGQPQQPGFPQQQQPGFPQQQQPGFPQQQQPGFPQQQQPGFPQQQQPGFPQQQQPGGFPVQQPPGYGVPVQAPGQIQSGGQTMPFGQTPFGQVQPGQIPGQPVGQPNAAGQPGQNAAAASMIWSQLTTPRQPPAGIFNNAAQGQSMGTGIAGVASMAETTGIKLYKEREKYNEWEFLYDLTEDAGARNLGGQQQGQGIPGTPGFGGGQSGFGGNPGFGGGQRIGGPGNGQIPFPGTGPGGVQIGPGGLPVGGPGQVIIQPGQPGGAPIRRAR